MIARPGVWLSAAVALIPPSLWYAHAHQLKEITGLTFGIWEVGSDKWGNLQLLTSPSFYFRLFFSRLIERHLAYAGLLLLAIGWVLLRHRRDLGTFKWWVGGASFYLLVVAKGNAVHDYYQLPLLLPLGLWVGAAIAWAIRRGRTRRARVGGRILVVAFLVLSLLRIHHFLRLEIASRYLSDLGGIVQQIVPPKDLVVVVDDGDPTIFYHIDRKGWHASVETLTEDWIEARRLEGAAYLVSPAKRLEPAAPSKLEMLQDLYVNRSSDSDFYVFDLRGHGH